MQLGIFAKTFRRPTLEQTLDAIVAQGLTHVQFNMRCVGLPTLPTTVDVGLPERIAEAFADRGLVMSAVSGTFNLIDPNGTRRFEGMSGLKQLASIARRLGTSVITLCTGTLDADDMWRRHPDNGSSQAWGELLVTINHALAMVREYSVTLAFEPELANVVDSARKARELLDAVGSPFLKVVIDPANLFHAGELPRTQQVLSEAFDALGPDIILAHAKDLAHDGEAGDVAAGRGLLDYDLYLDLLRRHGYSGPLILHGLDESEVSQSVAFVRKKMDQLPRQGAR